MPKNKIMLLCSGSFELFSAFVRVFGILQRLYPQLDNFCAIFKGSNWNFPVTFYVRYQLINPNSESMTDNGKGVNFLSFERNCGAVSVGSENECLVLSAELMREF